MPIPFKKVFLFILDGFGLADRNRGNAILEAGTPYFDAILQQYPSISVAAAGLIVGLPWGQPGNSEVGHSAIGTGRIMVQDLALINGEIRTKDFFKNPALLKAMQHAREHTSALHLIGCTSSGGIHSHIDHLIALLDLARREKVAKVFVHFIADGQDMPPQDAINALHMLQPFLETSGAKIASVQGRSFAMDRVLNWKLTEQVWHAIALGDAPAITDPEEYLAACYKKGQTDYDIEPRTVVADAVPIGILHDNDAVIFFDFRNDRVRQLATPFIDIQKFNSFDISRRPKNVIVVTMTNYADEFRVPVAYTAMTLRNTIGEVVSRHQWKQWRIAEKEKEAHVTNFFNGGRIEPFSGEQRLIVSSRMMKGKEYLEHPEMSAEKIVDAVREKVRTDARLYIINFANPDMIGHTGNLAATKKAVRVIDKCVGELIEELVSNPEHAVIITADHGNAEELIDPLTGGNDTQHSTRNVPAVFVAAELRGKEWSGKTLEGLAQEAPIGTLVDIAPSALYLLGLEKPSEMTGSRLISL